MEENKTYIEILTEVIDGTKNEDNLASVFNINLEDEETEKNCKELIDTMYEEYCTKESEEQGKGASVIESYVEKFKALAGTKEKAEPQPKLNTNENGTYVGFFLAPINHLQRITDALTKMAETDEELANAIKEGKKTFEGCDRFIKNNMKDIARELKANGAVTYDDETVHKIARWYMVNPDAVDVQNAVKAVETKKKESKPKAKAKAETKKAEPKQKAEKPKTKIVPLTPQMGSLFADEDFE